ncbi:MarR family winged helix-turn-helix transcriptional regulator [Glycomyces xiaoerkulensis]|uniref:MarR family winged helix-turn-helix transcriptional regulator n=1 Tax=Glycomyces xiaoerkulensis TaxID=2038139 RepID=UPI000DEEA19D|nr:MarR family transcriptional regulator [Glycomyces xiaoerkulensis]
MNPNRTRSKATEFRYLVLAAQREGNRWLTQGLREHGLTPSQAEVLTVLADDEPLTLADLGRYLVCETGSPSRLVDAMVRKGLVTREPDPVDRRVVLLRLTPSGRELVERVEANDERIDSLLEEAIGTEELAAASHALRRLIDGTLSGQKVERRFPVRALRAPRRRFGRHGGRIRPEPAARRRADRPRKPSTSRTVDGPGGHRPGP